MIKWMLIEPVDTLFFRDGKPFELGEESHASSFFPPNPSTFYGAIRTLLILSNSNLNEYKNNRKLKEIVGDENQFGTLKIIGPFIAEINDDYISLKFPLPRDLLFDKKNKELIKLIPETQNDVIYNIDKVILSTPEKDGSGNYKEGDEIEFVDSIYINISNYLIPDFYNLKLDVEEYISRKKFFYVKEGKVGIKINKKTNTVELHKLYSVQHIRFKDNYGFILGIDFGSENIDGINLNESGYFRLGGETRIVKYKLIENSKIENIFHELNKFIIKKIIEINKNIIKFILLTPAIFENGWYPDFLKENNDKLEGELVIDNYSKIKLRLISCVLGKSKYIGGFNLKNKCPKEMKKAVPEGSVYYFEIIENEDNEKIKNFIDKYNFNSIESDDIYKKQGFGIILIGGLLCLKKN